MQEGPRSVEISKSVPMETGKGVNIYNCAEGVGRRGEPRTGPEREARLEGVIEEAVCGF